MPTEWNYHADGVQTALKTNHSLDGSLSSITLQLDCFKTRDWTPAEAEEHPTNKEETLTWDHEDELYSEFADGAHATMKFTVDNSGNASLKSITPEGGDEVFPRHMPLLRAAVRVLSNIDGVESVADPMETLVDAYEGAEGIYIDRLDG